MLAAVMFFFIPIFSSTFALSVPEPPKGMMILDLAGFLPDSDIKQIDSRLKEIKKKTTSEIGILIISSLEGEDISEFSVRVFEKWKPGQKKVDNGLILVLAKKEKKYWVTTGYGIEGVLPDGLVGEIIRETLKNKVFKGGGAGSINKFLDKVMVKIDSQAMKDDIARAKPSDAKKQVAVASSTESINDMIGLALVKTLDFIFSFTFLVILLVLGLSFWIANLLRRRFRHRNLNKTIATNNTVRNHVDASPRISSSSERYPSAPTPVSISSRDEDSSSRITSSSLNDDSGGGFSGGETGGGGAGGQDD